MVSNGFGAERFIASLLILTLFRSYSMWIYGSLTLAEISQGESSYVRRTLSEMAGLKRNLMNHNE